MTKHIRETTTSTDLLIESGETDRPPGHFLVDCSCGEEYYVRPEEYGPKVTEFEALELARREHAIKAEQAPNGPLYNLLMLAKAMKVSDPMEIAKKVPGTLNFQAMTDLVYRACLDLFNHIEQLKAEHGQAVEDWGRNDEQVLADSANLAKQVELLQAELKNVRESAAANTRVLEVELTTLRRRTGYQGSGVLDPLTRLIMVAEELDADHEYWAVGMGEPTSREHRLDDKATVLREVYGDLKRVLDTVHPDSAYVGDRVRATWEVWKDGAFVEKGTKEGVVCEARVPGKNFIDFVADDGTVLYGHHNYEVTERFKPKSED